MNIFFDVDETILGYDGSLRPMVSDIFERLTQDGHRVYVWSGARTALGVSAVVAQYGLEPFVTDCFRKPLVNPRQAWLQTGIDVQPDFVIDDYPGIVEAFGGALIKPYPLAAPADQDMQRIYDVIQSRAREAKNLDP